MLTREEILTIEDYCAEHKMSHKSRLAELQIPLWDFYKAKKKYREEDSSVEGPGQFVQLSSGRYVPGKMPAVRAAIVYSLLRSCRAHDVDVRTWLVDILKRIPVEKEIDTLLPLQWQTLAANSH